MPFTSITPVRVAVPATSSAWQNLALSAYIPSGATGVIAQFFHTHTGATGYGFRKSGSSDDRRDRGSGSITSGVIIGCDSDRLIQVNTSSAPADQHIRLLGYSTGSDIVLRTNGLQLSSGIGDWDSYDLSALCPGAIGAIIEVWNAGSSFHNFGIRKHGSTSTRTRGTFGHNCFTIVVGCDTAQLVDLYRLNSDLEFYLTGYIVSGATFFTDGIDVTPTDYSQWVNTNLSDGGIKIWKGAPPASAKFYLLGYTSEFSFLEVQDETGYSGIVDAIPANYTPPSAAYERCTYHTSIFTPGNGVILKATTGIEIAKNQSILTASPTWTEISNGNVLDGVIKRGRITDLVQVQAGTALITMSNLDGEFWRENTDSSLYPYFKPLTLIRISTSYNGTTYRVFYGLMESIAPGWIDSEGGKVPTTTISCVDLFKSLNKMKLLPATGTHGVFTNVGSLLINASAGQKEVQIQSVADDSVKGTDIYLFHIGQTVEIGDAKHTIGTALSPEINTIADIDYNDYILTMENDLADEYDENDQGYVKKYPIGLSGTRMRDILIELGWPTALSTIADGKVYVAEFVPPIGGASALEHILDVAEAESGLCFIGGDGKIVFQDRDARFNTPYVTPQATFDDVAEMRYPDILLIDDDTFIFNQARIKAGDTEMVYEDTDYQSGAFHGVGLRVISRPDSAIAYVNDAWSQALVLVTKYKASTMRCESITIHSERDSFIMFPYVLSFDLSTRILLKLNAAPNTAMIDRSYHIESIEHHFNPNDLWQTKWQLWKPTYTRVITAEHTGYWDSSTTSYTLAQQAVSASVFEDTAFLSVGQEKILVIYGVQRGFVSFDTSVIGTDAYINSAKVAFELYPTDTGMGRYEIERLLGLHLVTAGAIDSPLQATDFGTILAYTTNLGAVSVGIGQVNQVVIEIDLNAAGIASIVQDGTTTFCIRSSRDILASPPSGQERLSMQGLIGTLSPKLVVELRPPEDA